MSKKNEPRIMVVDHTEVSSKMVIIDTVGQIPIIGGITGPILSPFKLDVETLRHLIAIRISVKEAIDFEGKRYYNQLTLDNYRKLAAVVVEDKNPPVAPPEQTKPLPRPPKPQPPVEEDKHPAETLPEVEEEEIKPELPPVEEVESVEGQGQYEEGNRKNRKNKKK